MKYETIISGLYESDKLTECINKLVPYQHRSDFRQDLMIIILTKPKENIVELHDIGKLDYYVARTIINLLSQSKNVYHKTYLNRPGELPEQLPEPEQGEDLEERKEREDIEDAAIAAIENLDESFDIKHDYYTRLLELYKKTQSMRKIQDMTGIPRSTVHRGIDKVRKHINEKFK